jgi:hypothetical protein
MPDPHLFEFLSRPEFKMCFALAWVSDSADYRGCYPLDNDSYRTPGSLPGKAEFWEESIRRAIRYLAFEHGYVFEAVRPRQDGRIDGREPITPENRFYRLQLADGGLPHILSALEEAARHLEERCPGFDLEPLLAAAADVRQSLAGIKIDPEKEALREQLRRSAFASLGIVDAEETLN